MNAFARAKAVYAQNRHDACRAATETLRPILDVDFRVSEFSLATLEAINTQWPKSHFDWAEIHRRYREPDCLKMAIWVGDRLSGVALGTTGGASLKIQFLEGDPRDDCPLIGRRILIALETMANYAQLRGKSELVLEPINDRLIGLYEDYGFEVVRPRKGPTFCRKRI